MCVYVVLGGIWVIHYDTDGLFLIFASPERLTPFPHLILQHDFHVFLSNYHLLPPPLVLLY